MTHYPDKLLPKSQQLIMVGNDLKKISFVTKGFPHLRTIDLRNSGIDEISTQAFQDLLLCSQNLKLSDNKLSHIPIILQTTSYQTNIWLSKNPYECNCEMMWMRDWLLNATNVMDKEDIICNGGKWNGNYFGE